MKHFSCILLQSTRNCLITNYCCCLHINKEDLEKLNNLLDSHSQGGNGFSTDSGFFTFAHLLHRVLKNG